MKRVQEESHTKEILSVQTDKYKICYIMLDHSTTTARSQEKYLYKLKKNYFVVEVWSKITKPFCSQNSSLL